MEYINGYVDRPEIKEAIDYIKVLKKMDQDKPTTIQLLAAHCLGLLTGGAIVFLGVYLFS